MPMPQLVEDELAIRRVLARYCHALDRMDKPAAYSVWHPHGTAHYHGIYEGSGHGFVDWVWTAHAVMERHSHQIAQSLIEVSADSAISETYVTVCLWTMPDDTGDQQELVARGRYLDRWARLDQRWAIEQREFVTDLHSVTDLQRAEVSESSARDASDPVFALFGK